MSSQARPELILASASTYRGQLLSRFGLPFTVDSADVDERIHDGEGAAELAQRLAAEKSKVVHSRHPRAIVIGSDQVAVCEGQILGKPGSLAAAREQLALSSGRCLEFYTAVSVRHQQDVFDSIDLTRVRMRALTVDAIERYLEQEPALDCAGAMKSEGAGILLTESIDTHDPTALIGLPLIAVAEHLRRCGLTLP
jgi:septum formation protein